MEGDVVHDWQNYISNLYNHIQCDMVCIFIYSLSCV